MNDLKEILTNRQINNWLPALTLLKREILRFASISVQTVFTPLMTASLYLLVFGVSLGKEISLFSHISYLQFVIPGLVLMGVAQNSYQNSSSSLFMARYLGYIVDFLVAPLSPAAFIVAYTVAAMVRGLIVGITIICVSMFFTNLPWPNPFGALIILTLTSLIFAQIGIIIGSVCRSFDTLSMYTNFLLQPLIYLGGLFYTSYLLPPFWRSIARYNPLLYLIDGFRGALIGESEFSFNTCLLIASILAILLSFAGSRLLARNRFVS